MLCFIQARATLGVAERSRRRPFIRAVGCSGGAVLRTWMIAFSRWEERRPQFVQPISAGRGDPPHKTWSQADSQSSGSPPAFTNSCSARRFIIRSVASSRAGRRCLTAIGVTACLLLLADNEKTASQFDLRRLIC